MIRSEPCTLAHIRAIIPLLRDEERIELAAMGAEPRHFVIALWRESYLRQTYFVDDAIAAIWGCKGMLADERVELWLLTTRAVERVPLTFFRESSRVLRGIMKEKRVVVSGILSGNRRLARTYGMLGFEIGPPTPYPSRSAEYSVITRER